jgi:tRNA pseudouridine38-40 synthase
LPDSIRVLDVEQAAADFHARHSCVAKTYEYRIWRAAICPPFLARYIHHYPYDIDESAMQAAAQAVVGEHDFTSFAAVDPEQGKDDAAQSNVRRISDSSWECDGDFLIYRVFGNGFLHHMVRNLVGTFLLIGKGTITPADIPTIIAARSRAAAGPTAPARGLYLVSAEY